MEPVTAKSAMDTAKKTAEGTVFSILLAISFSHLLNDTIQSLIPSIYPIVKRTFNLDFASVGLITLTFQLAASLFQPFIGYYTDKRPQPFSPAIGMGFTLFGLVLLSMAHSYSVLLLAVGFIGTGSSIFHPEASKVAFMASGGRRGLAQSIFQVGGNAGSSLGPLETGIKKISIALKGKAMQLIWRIALIFRKEQLHSLLLFYWCLYFQNTFTWLPFPAIILFFL